MNGASLHSLVLQNLRPRYPRNWYHPHVLLHEAHWGSEMRSPRGMRCGLRLRHDLLPATTHHCCTGVPSGGQVSAANPGATLSVYRAVPAHPGTPVGREAQINSRPLPAVFSQVLGDLKTKKEVLNLFQTSSCSFYNQNPLE